MHFYPSTMIVVRSHEISSSWSPVHALRQPDYHIMYGIHEIRFSEQSDTESSRSSHSFGCLPREGAIANGSTRPQFSAARQPIAIIPQWTVISASNLMLHWTRKHAAPLLSFMRGSEGFCHWFMSRWRDAGTKLFRTSDVGDFLIPPSVSIHLSSMSAC